MKNGVGAGERIKKIVNLIYPFWIGVSIWGSSGCERPEMAGHDLGGFRDMNEISGFRIVSQGIPLRGNPAISREAISPGRISIPP